MPIVLYDRAISSIIIVGGSDDGGGFGIDPATGEIIPIPPWEASRFIDLQSAIEVLVTISRFKNPRLAKEVAGPLAGFVQQELAELDQGAVG